MAYAMAEAARQAASAVLQLTSRWFDAVPGLRRLARSWPFVVVVLCTSSVLQDSWQTPIDTLRFSATGRSLWSSDWLNTFSDPWIQAGAAQLTLYGWTSMLERALDLPPYQVASVVIQFCVGFGLVGLVALPHRLSGRRAPHPLLLAAGLVGWLLAIPSDTYLAGHPAQFAITVLWVLAAIAALRDRPALAGILVAAASAFEPWGALGAPLLLLLPGRRRMLTAASWCAFVIALLWVPFVAFGEFAMHEHRWHVYPDSVLAPLLGSLSAFSWHLRLLQGGVALACGALAARALRGSLHAVWAVPMAVVSSRLLLDPVVAPYYWSPVKVLGLVAVATFVALRDERGLVVIPLLYPVLLLDPVPHWLVAVSVLAGIALLGGRRGSAPGLASQGGTGAAGVVARESGSVSH